MKQIEDTIAKLVREAVEKHQGSKAMTGVPFGVVLRHSQAWLHGCRAALARSSKELLRW